MKKIILSLAVIAIVGAVAISATGAFFSDTETSTGNTFTAGAIDLTVDSTQHYNGMVCEPNTGNGAVTGTYWWRHEGTTPAPAGTYPVEFSVCNGSWLATNLGAEKFFNFPDVKPGDSGENTISLHVDSNDAYACVDVNITKNADNSCTGPETTAEGSQCGTGNLNMNGELAQNLNFFAWADTASTSGAVPGDNIWQVGELALFTNGVGLASDVLGGKTYTLADASTGPLIGGATKYIGLAWCAGNMTASGGVISCDGSTMGNNTQTDSMEASVAFRVVQARNNASFKCSDATNPEHTNTTTVVGVNNLVDSATSQNGWFFYDDQTDFIQTNSAGHQFVVGPSTPTVGTGSVDFTKTATDKYGIATNQFIGTQLSTIGTLQFSTYRTTGTAAQAPSLGFDIDSNTTDTFTNYQGRLTYEPYFTHTVNTGVWQTWNTQDNAGAGNWWFSHATLSGGASSVCTQANPCTWSELIAAYPNIGITGRVIIRTNGADGEAANMNADKLVIGIGANTQTFDFGN